MTPHFSGEYDCDPAYNPDGSPKFVGHIWPERVWRFENSSRDPLTYHARDGVMYRPLPEFDESDLGSIPRLLRVMPSLAKDRFVRPYLFHDCARRLRALLVATPEEGHFARESLSLLQGDTLLLEMVTTLGANPVAQRLIFRGVRIGSWWTAIREAVHA